MDPVTTPAENPVNEMIQATTKVIEQVSEYSNPTSARRGCIS